MARLVQGGGDRRRVGTMTGAASRSRVVLAWSSGKDSAWALYRLRQAAEVDTVGLLTTFNREFDRVAMHAVRRRLRDGFVFADIVPVSP